MQFAGSDEFKSRIREVGGTRFDKDNPLRVDIPGITDQQSSVINDVINNDWRTSPMMNYRGPNLKLDQLSSDSIYSSGRPGENTRSTEGVMVDNLNLPEGLEKSLAKYKTPMSQALPGAQNIRRYKEG